MISPSQTIMVIQSLTSDMLLENIKLFIHSSQKGMRMLVRDQNLPCTAGID